MPKSADDNTIHRPIRVVFFGTPVFAATQLQALLEMPDVTVVGVITQPDRPAGRGQKMTPSAVKALALRHSIACLQPKSLRKEGENVLQFSMATGPWDLGVVAAYGLIVPQSILDLPSRGCLNVHGSLLPRWRGAAPIQRAIMAGDTHTGICLMRMEAGLDTGPVFARESTAIEASDTTGSLHDKLTLIGARLIKTHLREIIDGRCSARMQPMEGVTYAEKILKEEAAIDWQQSAPEIDRRIRGLNPAPGAFTELRGERLKLWAAGPIPCPAPSGASEGSPPSPGAITVIEDRLLIGCGSHTVLEIFELQPAGGKRLRASEYLRSQGAGGLPLKIDGRG